LTEVDRLWKQVRRRLRHVRRDVRIRRVEAHPAVGFVAVGLLILVTISAVVYALSL
jgi:hypothetical protein